MTTETTIFAFEAEVNSMLEEIFWSRHTDALLYDLWLTNIAKSKKFTIAPVFEAINADSTKSFKL